MRPLRWSTHADLAIRRGPTVGREEYLDHMTFRANVRPLFTEIFGPLVGLKEEWLQQGATPRELDFSAFRYRFEERASVPVATGQFGGGPEAVLEETEEHILTRDSLGRTMKLAKGASTLPVPLGHPVRTMDDWLRIRPWYAFSEARVAGDWEAAARGHRAAGRVRARSRPSDPERDASRALPVLRGHVLGDCRGGGGLSRSRQAREARGRQ